MKASAASEVSTTWVTNTSGSNVVILKVTKIDSGKIEYGWIFLGLIALALVAAGLRKLFWTKTSN